MTPSTDPFLVVGLGNPGPAYQATRHNAGFMVLDRLVADEPGQAFRRHRFGLVLRYAPGVWLMKPQTFMNRSGDAIAPMLRWLKINPGRLLVISDDLDLPLGKIRVRRHGSAGGHNGLKSIVVSLNTEQFARIRVGIGRPPDPHLPVIDWVLGTFSAAERPALAVALANAADATRVVLESGVEAAMNRYNASTAD